MIPELLAGALAGACLGYVLQRGQLCFHATVTGAYAGRFLLLRGWALGVAVAAVGFSVLLWLPGTAGLNHGLAFRPIGNVAGGVLIGVGMVVASSCISGLFFKLGSGMLGATVGLVDWGVGELAARSLEVPGPTVLPGGDAATVPGVLGVPRVAVALALVLVVGWLVLRSARRERPERGWQWGAAVTGLALGVAVTVAWALAAAGGSSFGASSVGAVAGVAAGSANAWLLAFLAFLVVGSLLAARTAGGWWLRGERPGRYLGLAAGGALLGAGGWIAGGCNLGHGLSGMSQLNVSSVVVVASMAAGVALARLVAGGLVSRRAA